MSKRRGREFLNAMMMPGKYNFLLDFAMPQFAVTFFMILKNKLHRVFVGVDVNVEIHTFGKRCDVVWWFFKIELMIVGIFFASRRCEIA